MKSPLDVVSTFPSKFQNGTFKAHNPPSSDNEDDSENDESPRNGRSGSHSRSKSHGAARSKSRYGVSGGSSTNKELAELRQQLRSHKAEASVVKAKYDLLVLRVNEFFTHHVWTVAQAEQHLTADEFLSENFAVTLATTIDNKDDYSKLFHPNQ